VAVKKKIVFGKKAISIRLDNVVLAFFRKTGRGWQSRINLILREWMEKNGGR